MCSSATSQGPRPKQNGNFRPDYHIAIAGGGLVGLLLAISLRQAGYRVSVFEQEPQLKEIGAGIILPANACRALDQAGVLKKIETRAVPPRAWVSHSYRDGTVLSRMELDPYIQNTYGVPFLVIHRPELRSILYEEAKLHGAEIFLGTKVDFSSTQFDSRLLRSTDGRTFEVDLIVAADGQQSTAREWLSGKANNPRPTGRMVNRILMGVDRMKELGLESLISPPCINVWLGPESLAVGYLLKGVFNFVLTCSSEKEPIFVGPKPVEKRELEAVFEKWDPRIRSLVSNGHGYLKWLLLNCDNKPSSWVHHENGKLALALTGDAAHAIGPFIGSGAALGFESVSVLAGLLAQANQRSDIPMALDLYEEVRRPRTDIVDRVTQKMSHVWLLPDGELQRERDRALLHERPPLPGYPQILEDPFFQPWLYGFDGRRTADEAWKGNHTT